MLWFYNTTARYCGLHYGQHAIGLCQLQHQGGVRCLATQLYGKRRTEDCKTCVHIMLFAKTDALLETIVCMIMGNANGEGLSCEKTTAMEEVRLYSSVSQSDLPNVWFLVIANHNKTTRENRRHCHYLAAHNSAIQGLVLLSKHCRSASRH